MVIQGELCNHGSESQHRQKDPDLPVREGLPGGKSRPHLFRVRQGIPDGADGTRLFRTRRKEAVSGRDRGKKQAFRGGAGFLPGRQRPRRRVRPQERIRLSLPRPDRRGRGEKKRGAAEETSGLQA